MKIALIGYGKMGKVIEGLALKAGDEIVLKVDASNRPSLTSEDLSRADVAIEFSRPESAEANIDLALAAGIPIVVGTTGWLAALPEVSARVRSQEGALLYASNFSVGVNVFFAAAQRLGELLSNYSGYRPAIEETHHLQKLDAPSGTAITLAERYLAGQSTYESWSLARVTSPTPQQSIAPAAALNPDKPSVLIHSIRAAGVPGTHSLELSSAVDSIKLEHTAHGREGFATGALVAARWLAGKQGVFTMTDLLGI